MRQTSETSNNLDPRILIAVPVRNGANLLERCIKSIVSQSYSDIEVVILDNNSTDGTYEIAEKYARLDSRFTVIRSSSDLSAFDNFCRAWSYAKGRFDFFMLLPHDDYISKNYVEEGLNSLQDQPNALAAAPKVYLATNGAVRNHNFNPHIIDQKFYTTFLRNFSALRFPASWFYSFFRTEAIETILEGLSSFPSAWGSDRMVVQLFLLRGKLLLNDRMSFYAETGSGSAARYMEKKFMRKLKLRIIYFQLLYKEKTHLSIRNLAQRFAFMALCWRTAAYDTTFTIRNLIRRNS